MNWAFQMVASLKMGSLLRQFTHLGQASLLTDDAALSNFVVRGPRRHLTWEERPVHWRQPWQMPLSMATKSSSGISAQRGAALMHGLWNAVGLSRRRWTSLTESIMTLLFSRQRSMSSCSMRVTHPPRSEGLIMPPVKPRPSMTQQTRH